MAETGFRMALEAEEAMAALAATLARIEQPQPLFDAIGLALVSSTDLRFETETGPDDVAWPKSIRVLLEGGKTLTDTARLRSSITHEASQTGVAVGTNAISAAVHQLGATIRPKNARALAFAIGGQSVFARSVTIPARPFLGLSEDDEAQIIELAGDWLLEPLGAGAGERIDG